MSETNQRLVSPAKMLLALFVFLIVGILVSLMIGRYCIFLPDIVKALTGRAVAVQIRQIIFQVRLPRIFAAVLVGGGLSVSGASYQGMFKNPLVSPDLLGSSSGAAFGAVIGIALSWGLPAVKLSAFVFGLLAVLMTWLIGTRVGKGGNTNFLLILGGILISSLFQSLITLLKYTADTENKLPEITFWLMGSLNKASYADVLAMTAPFALCSLLMVYISGKINILALGDEEAKTLGVNTRALKIIIVLTSTVLTSYSISITGTISWVGLIVPHLARMLLGPNFKYMIPGSLLLGGIYLLIMDNICRSLMVVEIPLGIATSLVGIPFFIILMSKKEIAW